MIGSTATLLTVRLFGTGWGTLAALLAGLGSVALWQHPCHAVVLVVEVLVVGMLLRRGMNNLVAADSLFWLFFGLPLFWLYYAVFVASGGMAALSRLVVHSLNGLACALLAALICHLLKRRQHKDAPPLLWETQFNLLTACLLFPAVLILLLNIVGIHNPQRRDLVAALVDGFATPDDSSAQDSDEVPRRLQKAVGFSLAAMLVPALGAAFLIPLASRRLTQPLVRLADTSRNLPQRLRDGEEIDWPQGVSGEIAALVENFRAAAAALQDSYRELESVRESSEEALDLVLTKQKWDMFSTSRKLEQEIGKRRRIEELLERIEAAETKYRFLVEKTLVGVFIVQENRFSYVNPRFAEVFGYTAEEIVSDCTLFDLVAQEDRALVAGNFRRQLAGDASHLQYEFRGRRKDGSSIHVEVLNGSGSYNGALAILGTLLDITERKKAEETVRHMAYHDPLTGLPNRLLFHDRVEQAIALARRESEELALLFIDLDRFKSINDTLGHDAGDELLREVAERIKGCVRESDTVSRFGGDEFNLLLTQIHSESDAELVAHKILRALRWPFVVSGHELHGTGSIGIALFPRDGNDVQSLIKNADTALYRAKDLGRNNYQIYNAAMNAQALERMELENSLYKVLERRELRVFYQAQVNLGTGRIVGMEALLRWLHPQGGLISPATFIPLAEEIGLIFPIGEWMMRTACRQANTWQAMVSTPLRLGINVSAQQFQDQEFMEVLSRILTELKYDPRRLNVEITESVVMQDVRENILKLRQLHAVGITVAIDDFGVGYSSLSYLKDFPVDQLKMDRSFVQNLPENANDAKIARHIVEMAHSLGLTVIAEGVENLDQLEFLRSIGCDEAQGYLLSLPIPAEEFEPLLLQADPFPFLGPPGTDPEARGMGQNG
jgi:diguanylate cyclase (GGDEF)-like protein/PAS domain S-box-containing protein